MVAGVATKVVVCPTEKSAKASDMWYVQQKNCSRTEEIRALVLGM